MTTALRGLLLNGTSQVCSRQEHGLVRFESRLMNSDSAAIWLNPRYAETLNRARLDSISAWLALPGQIVRHVPPRLTRRVELAIDGTPARTKLLYVKHHSRESYWSWIRVLLHGQRPVFGARPEYMAAVAFAELGIPSIEPVAFLEEAGESLLVTESIDDSVDLKAVSQQIEQYFPDQRHRHRWILRMTVVLADIARRMHASGWHHQDFYLNHLLWTPAAPDECPRLIDLGRARRHDMLPKRWIIKDLAQLEYSAAAVSRVARLRFLKLYLGRKLLRSDRQLILAIVNKASRIARHSQRHQL